MRYTCDSKALVVIPSKEKTTDLAQTNGLDLRPIVRWHEMHVEILEGLGEVNMTSGGDTGVIKFDETLRRFIGGWFIDMGGVEKMNEYRTRNDGGRYNTTETQKRNYTERESNPCRLLGRQA
jgi:hypothetical protein